MYDEFVLREEEGVGLDLPGTGDDLGLLLWSELGQVIDELDRVLRRRHHEVEVELKRPDALPPEVVPLQHDHVLHRFVSVLELQAQTHLRKLQEVGSEVVPDKPLTGVVLLFRDIYLSVFFYVH